MERMEQGAVVISLGAKVVYSSQSECKVVRKRGGGEGDERQMS